jgi:hypothetical protein
MSGDVAVKGKKRWVIRWPTVIVLHAITLRAERSGPHRADSGWQAILKARKAILPFAV